MTSHLYWAGAQFKISATIDATSHVRLVARGDLSCSGAAAVLRGAIARVSTLNLPILLDASDVQALSSAGALAARSSNAQIVISAASPAAAAILDALGADQLGTGAPHSPAAA